ncbi:glycosyltransferase family 4 protein [Microbacterium sp.]|uniref:glycosyltransferase family 4 protein n=1 Tax=Microbacterium sp. TaxID=51671 RepID=UPI002E2F7D6B|nr:glycosyltransferase family 4 protein [Microbacterium sp.]HEX5730975.1 glycosyltransferase family 4 protein [Microbacterium sp.]
MTGPHEPAPSRQRWLVATTEYAGLTAYTGGIGRHYAALLPALVRAGVDVDLMVFSDAAPRADADLQGVRLLAFRRTDRMSRVRAQFARARDVRAAYRRTAYDRVFLPEWAALGAALPRSAPLLTNLATSMRLANDVSGLRLRDLPSWSRLPVAVQSRLETRQIRRSAGLIPISTAMLARTKAMLGTVPPSVVVRNCIDVDRVRAAALTASLPGGWPDGDDPIVLFLGRSERRKGVIEAVAAFGELHRRMPRARLVLAGAGGDRRFEPTRSGLLATLPGEAQERVTWLGHVPGDELYRAIRAADVALCPSRWEGFGNVALEVKALGTPLIVTSGSGFDDFCADGIDCLMVPPADAGRLAEALHRLLDEPQAARALADHALAGIGDFAPDPVAADLIVAADLLLGARDRRSAR